LPDRAYFWEVVVLSEPFERTIKHRVACLDRIGLHGVASPHRIQRRLHRTKGLLNLLLSTSVSERIKFGRDESTHLANNDAISRAHN